MVYAFPLTVRSRKKKAREKQKKMATILALRDHTIAAIARRLPLCSAMCLARTCRRFSASLPAILPPCDDSTEPTRASTLQRLEARHFSSMCTWMRAYNAMFTVYPEHVAALKRWAYRPSAERTRTRLASLRLDLTCTGRTELAALLATARTLDLSHMKVTDFGAAALGRVRTLDLRFTRVTDVGAAALGAVHALNLSGTRVTDACAAALKGVYSLDLSETRVSDKAPSRSGASIRSTYGTRRSATSAPLRSAASTLWT